MNLSEKLRIGTKIIEGCVFRKNNILSVEFCITNRCNLSCEYCIPVFDYLNYSMNRGNKPISNEMSTQEIIKAFSILNDLNVERINISGGEPLVRDDIVEILEKAFLNRFKLSLTSNGLLVPTYIDLLTKLDLLIISIDGEEETHNRLRGKDTHKSVLKAIDLSKKKRIKIILSTVITPKTTEEDLAFLLKLCDFYDAFCVFQPQLSFRNGFEQSNKIEQPFPAVEQLEYLYMYLKNCKNKKYIVGGENFLRFILNFNKRWGKPVETLTNCMAGRFFLFISPDGSIFPCSIRLQKLFNNHIYESSPEEIKRLKIKKIKCSGCTCYAYMLLNDLGKLDFNAIINSLRYNYM